MLCGARLCQSSVSPCSSSRSNMVVEGIAAAATAVVVMVVLEEAAAAATLTIISEMKGKILYFPLIPVACELFTASSWASKLYFCTKLSETHISLTQYNCSFQGTA